MFSTIALNWFVYYYFILPVQAFHYQFNTSSLESCDLNIVNSNSSTSQSTTDLIETILLVRHANLHRILNMSPLLYNYSDEALTKPNAIIYEKCSINILVQTLGSFDRSLKRIFGTRIFSTYNIFLVIPANPLRYIKYHLKESDDQPFVATIAVIEYTGQIDNRAVPRFWLLCSTCVGKQFIPESAQVSVSNLASIRPAVQLCE